MMPRRLQWRAMGARYLAPQGRPTEAATRSGNPAANVRQRFEFANGFAITAR